MKNLKQYLAVAFLVAVVSTGAQAQVRFDVFSSPYVGPSFNVSVGNGYSTCNSGYYNRGYYNRGYYNRGYYAPVYYNTGYYNNGYYNNANCYTNGYYGNTAYRGRRRYRRNRRPARSPINQAAYWCNRHNEYCTH